MEINPFLGTLLGNIVLGLGIAITIFVIKRLKKQIINKLDYVTSLTVGFLISIVFLGLLPEILNESSLEPDIVFSFVIVGLLLFYILELFFHWHHCKDLGHDHCSHSHKKEHKSNFLMFSGTFVHNSFHGIILFSAFSIDVNFGFATTFAIFLHTIPQNIANYIMNHNNIKYAYIAAFGGIVGAILTFPFYNFLIVHQFEILAIISGGLLYTALADIFPNFKEKGELKHKIYYLFFMIIGVLAFTLFHHLI